jgi:hypothetical protein
MIARAGAEVGLGFVVRSCILRRDVAVEPAAESSSGSGRTAVEDGMPAFGAAGLWRMRSRNQGATTATLRKRPPQPTLCGAQDSLYLVSRRGRSSMVERQLPKLHTRVRFPSPAPSSTSSNNQKNP